MRLNLVNIKNEIRKPSPSNYHLHSGGLGECSGNIFSRYLQGLITPGYKSIKSQNFLFLWGVVVKMVVVCVDDNFWTFEGVNGLSKSVGKGEGEILSISW